MKRRPAKSRRNETSIGVRIAELRKELGLSQKQLAAKLSSAGLKVTIAAVSHWETGRADPAPLGLPDLAKVLRTTVDDLIDGDAKYQALREALA